MIKMLEIKTISKEKIIKIENKDDGEDDKKKLCHKK